jgi:hypothetical protein
VSEGDDAQDLVMLSSGTAEECKRLPLSGEVLMELSTGPFWCWDTGASTSLYH